MPELISASSTAVILNAGQLDTNPKRQRGRFPRWRFGLVSLQAASSIFCRGRISKSLGTGSFPFPLRVGR